MRQAIDNVTRSEAEKREEGLQVERDRICELNECIAQLQKVSLCWFEPRAFFKLF